MFSHTALVFKLRNSIWGIEPPLVHISRVACERVHLDSLGAFNTSEDVNSYVFMMIDQFT